MAQYSSKRLVALIGRPNVGKSTMFNHLTRSRKALVEDTPGLTRDRNYAEVRVNDRSFILVDTGGFEPTASDIVLSQMRTQTMMAVEQADIIIFLGDGKTGLTPSDSDIVRLLQTTDKKVFYVVNKIDSEKQEFNAVDFYELGVGELFPVSARTGFGMDEFLDALSREIPEGGPEKDLFPEDAIRVAVVGRPNVGKSTLINLLLGEERLVANPQPGTTRDSIDTLVRREGRPYIFIDTAGIRRRSRVVDKLEKYSVIKAFQSIDRAEVVIILMDSTEPVTDQDVRIAGYAYEKDRGIIIALNKWDLVEKDSKTINVYEDKVRTSLKYLHFSPIITVSAVKGTRAPKLFGLINDMYEKFRKRVTTGELNKFLENVLNEHPPGMHGSRRVKIYYATQVKSGPPTFMFSTNYPEAIHFSYQRYLENRIRETFDFGGSPLRLLFRKRQGRLSDTSDRAPARPARKRTRGS